MIGRVITISGTSGVGKTTVLRLLKRFLDAYFIKENVDPAARRVFFPVSHTTRVHRPGEVEGIDYFFVNDKRFRNLKSEMMDSVEFRGNSYGLHYSQFQPSGETAGDLYLTILTREGVDSLIERWPGKVFSILLTANLQEVKRRYSERLSLDYINSIDGKKEIDGIAETMVINEDEYDLVIENGIVQETASHIYKATIMLRNDIGISFDLIKQALLTEQTRNYQAPVVQPLPQAGSPIRVTPQIEGSFDPEAQIVGIDPGAKKPVVVVLDKNVASN